MESKQSDEPDTSEFRVKFRGLGVSATATGETILLELAEEHGVEIDSVCRAGSCQSCKVRLISGAVQQQVEGEFDAEEKAAGYILACSSTPLSDLEIEV